jgi:molybdenum cofactor biosynthesis enzyme MoaA
MIIYCIQNLFNGMKYVGQSKFYNSDEEFQKYECKMRNLGKTLSEDCKQKIRISSLGKLKPPLTEIHKNQIRMSNLGRKHSDEEKQKMRESKLGRKRPPRSKEWCEKISKSHLGMHYRRIN